MRQTIVFIFLFFSLVAKSQLKDSIVTKLFFESGFNKTRVSVISAKDTLLLKTLTTNYRIGYASILGISRPYRSIDLRAGKLSKKIEVHPKKFYLINVRDNQLLVEETDEEPLYR
jgi:hypothetical protein